MAPPIEQDQRTVVYHRMNFWGDPSSFNTVSWEYEGRSWQVNRPDDGSPAVRTSVRCPVCSTTLNYTVHSVSATRRRRVHRWAWAACGLAVVVLAPLSLFIVGTGTVRVTVAIVAAALGFFIGYLSLYVAARETGFTGHGASWPVIPKHLVTLLGSDSEEFWKSA